MGELLEKTAVEVSCRDQVVVLDIGNLRFSIEFPLALQLAAALKFEGRIAKLNSGNRQRGFTMVGVLHDVAAPKTRRQRFAERLPDFLRPHNLGCKAEGSLVVVQFGNIVIKMPYAEAIELSQWLRVRGKQARNNAGETAHWSEIVARAPQRINGHAQ